MESNHTAFSCKDSGLVVNLTHIFIGANTDGVVHCECCGHGVIEIKCPYCIKDKDPGTASCLLIGKLSKKHAQFYQVQTQLVSLLNEFYLINNLLRNVFRNLNILQGVHTA